MDGPMLVLIQRSEETRQHRGKTSQLWTLPHAATLNVAIQDRTLVLWVGGVSKMGVRNPSQLSVL